MELQPIAILAGVHVALGEAAGPPRSALGVGEHEGALDRTLRGLCVASEHGVHGGVPRNVGAQPGVGAHLSRVLAVA